MAPRRTKVLYLHHAGVLGGSLVSLRELLRFLDRDRFEAVVALLRPGEAARAALEAVGASTIRFGDIGSLDHTTAFWSDPRRPRTWPPLVETALGWRRSMRRTLELVDRVRPDVVHVSSVVLAPSAAALGGAGVPFVWHVREMPAPGGALRFRLQRRGLRRWPGEVIFLSEVAREAWVGGERGVVIPEPVDPALFDPALDARAARRALGIAEGTPVVLFVGGLSEIKGIVPLLRAIPSVAREIPGTLFVMPGARPAPAGPWPFLVRAGRAAGMRTSEERVEAEFQASGAAPHCLRLPFSNDVPQLLAASDLLVFPATQDHFARPIVEAAFMERPAVASRLPMIAEAVRDGETGFLVPPGDPGALARAIVTLLRDPARRREMGRAARGAALRRFDAGANARATERVYARLTGVLEEQGESPGALRDQRGTPR